MTVKEFLEATYSDNKFNTRDFVVCNDGFRMSVQGGTEGHYCIPRKHCNQYDCVEVGYLETKEESLFPYADDVENPADSVYGFVPIEVVEEIVKRHGGIKEEA